MAGSKRPNESAPPKRTRASAAAAIAASSSPPGASSSLPDAPGSPAPDPPSSDPVEISDSQGASTDDTLSGDEHQGLGEGGAAVSTQEGAQNITPSDLSSDNAIAHASTAEATVMSAVPVTPVDNIHPIDNAPENVSFAASAAVPPQGTNAGASAANEQAAAAGQPGIAPEHTSGAANGLAPVAADSVAPAAAGGSAPAAAENPAATEGPAPAAAQGAPPPAAIANADPLPEGMVITTANGGTPTRIETVSLDDAFAGKPMSKRRIERIMDHPGSHSNAINLNLADVARFNSNTRYLQTFDSPPATAVFFVVGVTTYNGLSGEGGKGRQLCVAPLHRHWSRATAVLRSFSGESYMFLSSYHKGVSFSSGQFDSNPGDDPRAFRNVLPRDFAVPVYDGRENLQLSKYYSLDKLAIDVIEKGTTVAVLFTINFYRTTTARPVIKRDVVRRTGGLNIQAVIVLDDKNPEATGDIVRVQNGPLHADVAADPTLNFDSAVNLNALAAAPAAAADPNEPTF